MILFDRPCLFQKYIYLWQFHVVLNLLKTYNKNIILNVSFENRSTQADYDRVQMPVFERPPFDLKNT